MNKLGEGFKSIFEHAETAMAVVIVIFTVTVLVTIVYAAVSDAIHQNTQYSMVLPNGCIEWKFVNGDARIANGKAYWCKYEDGEWKTFTPEFKEIPKNE